MKTSFRINFLVFVVLATPLVTPSEPSPTASVTPPAYEELPESKTRDILEPEFLNGPHHKVRGGQRFSFCVGSYSSRRLRKETAKFLATLTEHPPQNAAANFSADKIIEKLQKSRCYRQALAIKNDTFS